jgi:hypothetical protein
MEFLLKENFAPFLNYTLQRTSQVPADRHPYLRLDTGDAVGHAQQVPESLIAVGKITRSVLSLCN